MALVKRTVIRLVQVMVQGRPYSGVWFFDGNLLRFEVPDLLAMPLWMDYSTEYGTVYWLADLLNGDVSETNLCKADEMVVEAFNHRLLEVSEYNRLRR